MKLLLSSNEESPALASEVSGQFSATGSAPSGPFFLSPSLLTPNSHKLVSLSPILEYQYPQMGFISGLGVSNFTFLQVFLSLDFERRSVPFWNAVCVYRGGYTLGRLPLSYLWETKKSGALWMSQALVSRSRPVLAFMFSGSRAKLPLQSFYSEFHGDQRSLYTTHQAFGIGFFF